MAEDPALPLTDVQLVLGHALLTTTQLYLTPRKEDVIRRILAHHDEQVRQARQRGSAGPGAGLPAREPGCAVREPAVVSAADAAARRPPSVWLSGYQAARTRFPPRPAAAGLAGDLAGPRPGSRAAELACCPATSARGRHCWTGWPLRTAAAGSSAGWPAAPTLPQPDGGRLPRDWLRRSGHPVPAVAALVSALIAAICADIVRPSLAWLAAGGRITASWPAPSPRSATRTGSRGCGQYATATRPCRKQPAATRCAGPRSSWPPRAARWPISAIGRSAGAAGCRGPGARHGPQRQCRLLPAAAPDGVFGPAAPARLRQLRTAGQRTPEELIDRHQLACQPGPRPARRLPARTPAGDGLRQPGTAGPQAGACSGPTWKPTIPASTACA